MADLTACLLAYLVGCVSFALLVCRLKGVDIRAHGSGNPGATNVGRLLGKRWGRAVLVLDILKGLLPVALLSAWPGAVDADGKAPILAAVVTGHVFPLTAGFRGGKGVAAFIGGTLAYDPLLALLSVGVHSAVKRTSGFVSLASVALAWSFPLLQLAFRAFAPGAPGDAFWDGRRLDGLPVTFGLALLITLRHAPNFARMRAGTEYRADAAATPRPGQPEAREAPRSMEGS